MHQENLKQVVKSAYLLQLKYGSFTDEELIRKVGTAEFQHALKLEYVAEEERNGQRRCSLTDKGRSQIKVVLAGGVYDVLHVGHLAALSEAKSLGDVLIAVVATDATVELLKGRRPIFPESDRRALVEGLKPVDKAILGYEDVGFGFEQILIDVKPEIVAFGFDQDNLEKKVPEIIERRKMNIRVVRLSKFEHEEYVSSSAVRQKLSEQMR